MVPAQSRPSRIAGAVVHPQMSSAPRCLPPAEARDPSWFDEHDSVPNRADQTTGPATGHHPDGLPDFEADVRA